MILSKLDRYISRKFLFTFSMIFTGIIVIFLIVRVFERIHRYIDYNPPFLKLAEFFLLGTPEIIVMILPMIFLLAVLFTLSGLSKTSELTAMKSVGVSLYRIIAPFVIFSFFLTAGAFILNEELVPIANERAQTLKDQMKGKYKKHTGLYKNIKLKYPDGYSLSVNTYNSKDKSLNKVYITRISDDRITEEIYADKGYYLPDSSKWILREASIKRFTDSGDDPKANFESIQMRNYAVTEISILEKDLIQKRKSPKDMNYTELQAFIERSKLLGKDYTNEMVGLYHKVAYPFTNIIILLFAIRITANVRKGHSLAAMAASLVIAFVYFGVDAFFVVLGENKLLHPFLAAWAGNLLFFCLGMYNLFTTRK